MSLPSWRSSCRNGFNSCGFIVDHSSQACKPGTQGVDTIQGNGGADCGQSCAWNFCEHCCIATADLWSIMGTRFWCGWGSWFHWYFINLEVPSDVVVHFALRPTIEFILRRGGTKSSTNTVEFIGDKAGEGMVYMLKNCPYVCSLSKLIQKGFNFICGPDPEPTLVPPDVLFNVTGDKDRCHVADPVDHCVPIFRETIWFTYVYIRNASCFTIGWTFSLTCTRCRSSGGWCCWCCRWWKWITKHRRKGSKVARWCVDQTPRMPHGDCSHMSKDIWYPWSWTSSSFTEGWTVDHLLTRLPAHPNCDVCAEAKPRAKTHKRFPNQKQTLKETRVIETPNHSLQKIWVDHLESTEVRNRGETICICLCWSVFRSFDGLLPPKSKNQQAVELSLRHFIGDRGKPVVVSDRYQSILAGIRAIGCVSDPTPPNANVTNLLAESSINLIR